MRIMAVVDNKNWCWTSTARDLSHAIPEHEFKFVPARNYHPSDWEELVWCRGYARSIAHRNAPKVPWVWTMTTGGARLEKRLAENEGSRFVICQCRHAYDTMLDLGYTAWMIPNGINATLFKPSPPKSRVRRRVGFAGNIADSRNQLKGVDFVRAGCEKCGIPFVSTTSHNPLSHLKMADWYRGLWAYAQPSEAEGCSNSVMEAMACGLPVLICEGVGYHGEMCRDGIRFEGGEVVFVKRDAADIASKLAILLENPYLYRRVSRNARNFAESHGWKHVAPRMKSVFEHVAGRKDMPQDAPERAKFQKKQVPASPESPPAPPPPPEPKNDAVYVAARPVMIFGDMYSPAERMPAMPPELIRTLLAKGMVREQD